MKNTPVFKILIYTIFGVVVVGLVVIGGILAFENMKKQKEMVSGDEISSYKAISSRTPITDFLISTSSANTTNKESSRIYLYNQGISFVEEVRSVNLSSGKNLLHVQDIPRNIVVDSLLVSPIGEKKFQIFRQVFRDQLTNEFNFFNSLVGKEVTITNISAGGADSVSGKLLGANNGYVLESSNSLEIFNSPDRISVHDVLRGEYQPNPSIILDVNTGAKDNYEFRASYLTGDFSWEASYVAMLDDQQMDLSGWANIKNSSGISFNEANITLVSGEINLVSRPGISSPRGYMEKSLSMPATSFDMADEAFFEAPEQNFEYHTYELKTPLTIDKSPSQSIAFLKKPDVKVEKQYVYQNGSNSKTPLSVNLKLENRKENGLGLALPKGVVRFYSENKKGSLFLGEVYLPQFNTGDEKDLFIGRAMDLLGERYVRERNVKSEIISLGRRCTEEKIEIIVTNEGDEPRNVLIKESLQGRQVTIKSVSVKNYEKKDTNNIEIPLMVDPETEKSVEYVYEYCY